MKCFRLLGILLLSPALLGAYDWPGQPHTVDEVFAMPRDSNSLAVGMTLETSDVLARAAEEGEVLFVGDPSNKWFQGGASEMDGFLIMSHKDEIRSVVTHLTFIPGNERTTYKKGEIIGRFNFSLGELPETAGSGTYTLSLFQQQKQIWLNPASFFPAYGDTKAPFVLEAAALGEQGERVILGNRSTLSIGYWDISFMGQDAILARGKEKPLGLYFVGVYLNGNPTFELELDTLRVQNGRFILEDLGVSFEKIIEGHRWNLGRIFVNQGTNILEIVLKDASGNQSSQTFRLIGSLR